MVVVSHWQPVDRPPSLRNRWVAIVVITLIVVVVLVVGVEVLTFLNTGSWNPFWDANPALT